MNPNSSSSTPWDSPTTRSVSSSLEERLPKSEKYKKNERSGLNSYPQTTVHIHRKYTTHKQLKDHKPHPKTSENSTKPTSSQTQTHHQQDPKTENHHHQFKKKKNPHTNHHLPTPRRRRKDHEREKGETFSEESWWLGRLRLRLIEDSHGGSAMVGVWSLKRARDRTNREKRVLGGKVEKKKRKKKKV